MKVLKTTLFAGMAFGMLACTNNEPKVKTEHQIVTLENSKQYSIPVGSSYTKAPVTEAVINRYTEFGVKHCQHGDITWEDEHLAERINNIMRNGTKEEGIALYKEAAKSGEVGCASPLPHK